MRTTIGAPGAESKRCLLTQHLLDNLCLAAGNDLVRSQTTGQTRGLVLQVVATVRLTLPLPVSLKRFLAPEWVFCFGIAAVLLTFIPRHNSGVA